MEFSRWLSGQRIYPLAMQEIQVQSRGEEDSLEEGMATHSSTLAWRTPWAEEPGRVQSMRSQKNSKDKAMYKPTPSLTVSPDSSVFPLRKKISGQWVKSWFILELCTQAC